MVFQSPLPIYIQTNIWGRKTYGYSTRSGPPCCGLAQKCARLPILQSGYYLAFFPPPYRNRAIAFQLPESYRRRRKASQEACLGKVPLLVSYIIHVQACTKTRGGQTSGALTSLADFVFFIYTIRSKRRWILILTTRGREPAESDLPYVWPEQKAPRPKSFAVSGLRTCLPACRYMFSKQYTTFLSEGPCMGSCISPFFFSFFIYTTCSGQRRHCPRPCRGLRM